MLDIPEKVKELFQTDSIKKNLRISFPDGEHEDIISDQIVKDTFTFKESLCSGQSIQLGFCEASVAQFEVVGVGNIKGYKIKIDCEIDCSSLGSEWCDEYASESADLDFPFYSLPFGIFYIDKCPKKSGANKNRRQITAYTKQAYDDWETPISIQSALKLGWGTTRSFSIPLDAIQYTEFPELCTGSYTSVTTRTLGSSSSQYWTPQKQMYTSITYKTASGVAGSLNLQLVGLSYRATGIANTPSVIKYRAKVGSGTRTSMTTFINDIVAKMESKGYVVDQKSVKEALNRATQIKKVIPAKGKNDFVQRKDLGSSYAYYYPSADRYGIQTSNFIYFDKLLSSFHGYEYELLDYIAMYDESNYITKNDECDEFIVVPNGYYFSNTTYSQNRELLPDYVTSGYTEFDSTLEYFIKSDFSGFNITYDLDKSRRGSCLYTETGATSQRNEYYAEKELDVDVYEIIQANAELQGLLGKFDRYGKFSYISVNGGIGLYPSESLYPKNDLYPQEPSLVLTNAVYNTASWEDQYNKPFDRVSVDYKNEDDAEVYAYIPLVDMEDEYYDPDDYQSYTLGTNWFIKNKKFTSEEIGQILETVASNISNIKYMPSEVEMRGLPYLEAGDYVEFLTDDSGFQTIILENVINGEKFLKQTITSN